MKLSRITINNILGVKHVEIEIGAPIIVLAGRNGAAKSSIAECIRIAMLGAPDRVTLKSEYGQLVHQGAKAGSIEIHTHDDEPIVVKINAAGKVEDSARGRAPDPTLAYVLDPGLFARQADNERRAFLFGLSGLACDGPAVVERLSKRGLETAKIDAIAPLLRAGFEVAQKEAAKRATEAKGAWRALSGETWGSQKGGSWRAPVPAFSGEDAAALTGIDKAIAGLEQQLGDAQKRLGIAEYEAGQQAQRERTLVHLRETAKAFAYHTDLVNRAEKDLAGLEAQLLDAQQQAGTKQVEWATKLTCPHCGGAVMDSEDGESLVLWVEPPPPQYDPEAAARIPELLRAIATQEKVLARHRGNLAQAEDAGKQLKALDSETNPANRETKPADPESIRGTVDTLRQQIETQRRRQRELQAAHRLLDEADGKTKQARAYHADVLAWSAIADALAPDGIPGEMLAEALGPINKRLAQSALDTGWQPVTIDADMAIRYGGRLHRLLSESERWRVDAMIGEAISHLSGLGVLVLDRMDVLDVQSRADLLNWLETLSDAGEIATALVLATLKQPVTWDGNSMQSVWLERGEIRAEREREAA